MSNRKAFTLMEMLIVTTTSGFMLVATAGLFKTLSYDIPRGCRTANENTSVLNLMDSMRRDVTAATALPQSHAGYESDEQTLLVELSGGKVVCYEFKDAVARRLDLSGDANEPAESTADWSLPHSVLALQTWRDDDKGYAVEISTYVEHMVREHRQKKFANSHVFFVNNLGKAARAK